jgi:Ca2+-binding RTX toxin-like protein
MIPLPAGPANDSLSAGSSSDTLDGGSGDDTFAVGLSSFIDVIDGGAGMDLLTADYHNGFSTIATTVTLSSISGTIVHGSDQVTFTGVERFEHRYRSRKQHCRYCFGDR